MRQILNRQQIDSVCIGYSNQLHWEFFRIVLTHTWVKKIAVIGVYYGRDIAYMASILHQLNRKDYMIVGVDKFENSFCEDWPQEKRHLTWEEAGYGVAPNLNAARSNLIKLGLYKNVFLTAMRDVDFLKKTHQNFDLVYIDTSHDYNSVKTLIQLSNHKLNNPGFFGGDDYSDSATWGVASAVKDSFVNYNVYFDWLWLANKHDLTTTNGHLY